MMNHADGWMGGWMAAGMWIWMVIRIAVVVLLVVLIGKQVVQEIIVRRHGKRRAGMSQSAAGPGFGGSALAARGVLARRTFVLDH